MIETRTTLTKGYRCCYNIAHMFRLLLFTLNALAITLVSIVMLSLLSLVMLLVLLRLMVLPCPLCASESLPGEGSATEVAAISFKAPRN